MSCAAIEELECTPKCGEFDPVPEEYTREEGQWAALQKRLAGEGSTVCFNGFLQTIQCSATLSTVDEQNPSAVCVPSSILVHPQLVQVFVHPQHETESEHIILFVLQMWVTFR